jgi:hypothetical protein
MTDDEFLAQLEACTLPADCFHHADHLHAAWLYLSRFAAAEAIARFSATLREYATSLGKADRYHETITWAYLLLVNERIRRAEPGLSWQQFVQSNADLFGGNNSVLLKYYCPETLSGPIAREVFLMPDRLAAIRPV